MEEKARSRNAFVARRRFTHLAAKFRVVSFLVAFASLFTTACVTTESQTKQADRRAEFIASSTARVTATVELVDRVSRVLAVREPGGRLRTMRVGEAVADFDLIERGDRVTTEVREEVAVSFEPPGAALSSDDASVIESAPRGGKPVSVAVDSIQRVARVESVDPAANVVTFRDREGRAQALKIDPEDGLIARIAPGDQIMVRYTRVVAVSVTTAP